MKADIVMPVPYIVMPVPHIVMPVPYIVMPLPYIVMPVPYRYVNYICRHMGDYHSMEFSQCDKVTTK